MPPAGGLPAPWHCGKADPPMNRMTDRCKTLSCPKLRLRTLIINFEQVGFTHQYLCGLTQKTKFNFSAWKVVHPVISQHPVKALTRWWPTVANRNLGVTTLHCSLQWEDSTHKSLRCSSCVVFTLTWWVPFMNGHTGKRNKSLTGYNKTLWINIRIQQWLYSVNGGFCHFQATKLVDIITTGQSWC